MVVSWFGFLGTQTVSLRRKLTAFFTKRRTLRLKAAELLKLYSLTF
jgi:hypothetical protein